MEIKKVKGTRDYFGDEAKKIDIFFSELSKLAINYGYEKIFAPIFEETSLFSRSVGLETDVVNKEMYSFDDRNGKSITLRPEGTAQAVRLALENKLLDNNKSKNLFYINNMFRYERPQKGRQREFFQFGVESFGKKDPYVDVEIIQFADSIFKHFEVNKYELQINTIGNSIDRNTYNKELKSFVEENIEDFSDYGREKISGDNVLRILDSKDKKDLKLLEDAPKLIDYINDESKQYFEEIKTILTKLNIKFVINEKLVRGLDYYNDLVFEFVSTDEESLGAKSTLLAGGRYDNLVKIIDNKKDIPAIGFAMGIERMMLASKQYLEKMNLKFIDYYVLSAYNEEDKKEVAFDIATKLRNKNFSVYLDLEDKKLSKKISNANNIKSSFIIIIGNEINDGIVTIKEIKTEKIEKKKIKEI